MINRDLAALALVSGLLLLFASYACIKSREYKFATGLSLLFNPVQRSQKPILFWSLVGVNFAIGVVGVGLAFDFALGKPF